MATSRNPAYLKNSSTDSVCNDSPDLTVQVDSPVASPVLEKKPSVVRAVARILRGHKKTFSTTKRVIVQEADATTEDNKISLFNPSNLPNSHKRIFVNSRTASLKRSIQGNLRSTSKENSSSPLGVLPSPSILIVDDNVLSEVPSPTLKKEKPLMCIPVRCKDKNVFEPRSPDRIIITKKDSSVGHKKPFSMSNLDEPPSPLIYKKPIKNSERTKMESTESTKKGAFQRRSNVLGQTARVFSNRENTENSLFLFSKECSVEE